MVEEIKNRAKGCIGSRNFPVAAQLYSKAIEVMENELESSASLAILRANRSMCHLSIGNAGSALEDAVEAESLDPSYIKVYYRKAAALNALNRYGEAKAAILKGLEAKPDDKEMRNFLVKIDAAISSKGTIGSTSGGVEVKTARTTVKNTSNGTASTNVASNSSSNPTPSSIPSNVEADDDDEESLGNVRGYKKRADGRVTTFFNNDLDETAKQLIGDIAPKKLQVEDTSIATQTTSASGGSVWNSAGTYEEKQLTPWASAELKARLAALEAHLDAASVGVAKWSTSAPDVASATVSVADVENLVGDAQVSMVRGKKKHLCDFCADLKWTLSYTLQSGVAETVTGRLQLLDLSADQEYEVGSVDVTHFNGSACSLSGLSRHAGLLVANFVKKSTSAEPLGLQRKLHDAVVAFCAELKTK